MTHSQCTKGYTREKLKRPPHTVVVKSTDEQYGALDSNGSLGRRMDELKVEEQRRSRQGARNKGHKD